MSQIVVQKSSLDKPDGVVATVKNKKKKRPCLLCCFKTVVENENEVGEVS